MTKTIVRRTVPALSGFEHLHPLLQRIFAGRGLQHPREIERSFEHLLPFRDLLNIEKAVACLAEAVTAQQKVLVVGDFDADGATSTAVAIRALKSFGLKEIDYLVPNRFAFGYGLTPELVEVAKTFQPSVIVTVDNGISNNAGVAAAKALGIKVVITDHHLAADELPLADAIVNPNQPHDTFPSKCIAGVGVIFYVMLALRRHLSDIQWFKTQNIPEPNMSHLLDIVALGTVADVVALDHNNRIMVHQGLRRIRASQCIVGITALLEISQRHPARVAASDLGFAIAPRLNAAGRLDDMSLGIECLLTDDMTRAREIAQTLNQLNEERRVIEQDMQEQALFAVKKITEQAKKLTDGICLFDPEWHQGVIGILAGRIKDKFHRPVIAFALANDSELKGSARSIPGLHIRDILADISALYPDLIGKFGGHAMAAGLTIMRSAYESFTTAFNEVVTKHLGDMNLQNVILSDGELRPSELTMDIAELIREAGPWGQAFSEPIFDGDFEIIDQRLVGSKHLKMILRLEEKEVDAIAFNIDTSVWPNHRCEKVRLAYRIDVNEFRGKKSLQLMVEHLSGYP